MLHRFLPLATLMANDEQRRRWIAFAAVSALALIVAHLVDGWAYRTLGIEDVHGDDFGRLLRIAGYVPTWLLASAALVLTDWPRRALEGTAAVWRRGLLLLSGVVAAGIAGELLKLAFRRERPRAHDGEYVFRAFTEHPFYSVSVNPAASFRCIRARGQCGSRSTTTGVSDADDEATTAERGCLVGDGREVRSQRIIR